MSEGLTATVPGAYSTESPLQRESKGGVFKRQTASETHIHMLFIVAFFNVDFDSPTRRKGYSSNSQDSLESPNLRA